MKNQLKKNLIDLAFVLINLAMTTIACLFLSEVNIIFRVLAVLSFLLLCILIPSISEKYKSAYRLLITISIFLSIVLITYVILDAVGLLSYFKDFEKIKEIILSTKQWGVIVFLLISILQIVILPIPAAITILIGVAIYGMFWSFVLSTVATYIGSIIAFALGRTFGKRLVYWIFGQEQTEKYAKLISSKGKGLFVIMLLLPFFPDDLLCMVAGISSMSKKFFLISMMITRPVMIAITAFFGSGKIIPFNGWGIPVWIVLIAITIIILVITFIKSKNSKNKNSAA